MILPYLVIAPSNFGGEGGLGVYSSKALKEGMVIEISPVIILNPDERKLVEATKLYNYIFEWGVDSKDAAVGLGYLSMYNHSYHSNCEYEMDFESRTMQIKTMKAIKKGEELLINYNGNFDDTTPVWFDVL